MKSCHNFEKPWLSLIFFFLFVLDFVVDFKKNLISKFSWNTTHLLNYGEDRLEKDREMLQAKFL